jgi:GH15 family glucan-1,4-alpha-glucosidase
VTSEEREALAGVGKPHVLREYSLLADGERGAVVGPRGDFAWMCFPRWDSDACFATLIGGQGTYAVAPLARYVWGGYYERGLIWRSRWITEDGVVECREALALPASRERVVVLRRILARQGPARVVVVLDVRGRFGSEQPAHLRRDDDGRWTGRIGDVRMTWVGGTDAERRPDGGGGRPLVMTLELEEGASHDLVLVLDASAGDRPPPDPDRAWSGTEAGWSERLPELRCATAGRDARHSYAVLSGLTSGGGGMVAAATMSLPERARQGRNYDYRYVWIRDQCFAGQAGVAIGSDRLVDAAVGFVGRALHEHGAKLAPAYTVTGESVPAQRRLGLAGYPGGYDIVGNQAGTQFQLDGLGEALQLFAAADRAGRLDGDGVKAAEIAAAAITKRWREPDAGIWELDNRAWTHSRLLASAGLRAMAAAPSGHGNTDWLGLADRILADTAANAVHPDGHWQRAAGDPRLDAALLLAQLRGATAPDDPRATATLRAYLRDLTLDGYAYRFRHDSRPLHEAEGSFLLCGFLVALALHQQGRSVPARAWFERTSAATGPPELFSEEYDCRQHQMRGNLPQAFVHALMIETAARLGKDTTDASDAET